MKITATNFQGKDERISLEAETEAEKFQMQGSVSQLELAGADWGSWDDMEGKNGICIITKLKDI